jgi:hypothetical protein
MKKSGKYRKYLAASYGGAIMAWRKINLPGGKSNEKNGNGVK